MEQYGTFPSVCRSFGETNWNDVRALLLAVTQNMMTCGSTTGKIKASYLFLSEMSSISLQHFIRPSYPSYPRYVCVSVTTMHNLIDICTW